MKMLLLLVLMFELCTLPLLAETAPGIVNAVNSLESDGRYRKYEDAYKAHILTNFSGSTAPDGLTILFSIQKNGYPTRISVFDSSKSMDFDIAAIEAFITSMPLEAPPAGKTLDHNENLLPARVDFKPRKLAAIKKNAQPPLIHAIPLEVLTRYPNMFTRSELESPENLLTYSGKLPSPPYAVLPGTSHDHPIESISGKSLFEFLNSWALYFGQHKISTKSELLKERDNLLRKFKQLKRVST